MPGEWRVTSERSPLAPASPIGVPEPSHVMFSSNLFRANTGHFADSPIPSFTIDNISPGLAPSFEDLPTTVNYPTEGLFVLHPSVFPLGAALPQAPR